MTILGSLTFEDYEQSAAITDGTVERPWYVTGSTPPIALSGAAMHGERGASISGATSAVKIEWREAQTTATRVISAYFRITQAGGSAVYMGDLLDGGTGRADWRINADRTVTIRNNFVATGGASPQVLELDVTYRYEWHTSSSGQELRIYEGESESPYITRAGALTSNSHTIISAGLTATPSGWGIHLDTIQVADDWVGPFAPVEPPPPHRPWKLITAAGVVDMAPHVIP